MDKLSYLDIAQDVLGPPGSGVYTVNTASDVKHKLYQKLYQTTDIKKVHSLWLDSLKNQSKVHLLGLASDCGAGIQRGANWGPLYIRDYFYSNNPDHHFSDLGDIKVIAHLLHDKYLNDLTIKKCAKALYNDENSPHPVAPLSLCEYFLDIHYQNNPNARVLTLGGDHSASYPAVKSYLKNKKAQKKKAAIIHFDAHTDLLVERQGIDLCFGSWCTHILDDLSRPEHLVQIGIRSSGKDRTHWENTFGVTQYWAHDAETLGAATLAKQVSEKLKKDDIDELYVSFDIDALDETEAMACGTPESGGLKTAWCLQLLSLLNKDFKITGADLMEVAPNVRHVNKTPLNPEPEATLMASEALVSFFHDALEDSID